MKKALYKRKRFWGIIVIVIFFGGLSLFNHISWSNTTYVGEITEITENSITILDKRKGEQIFQIGDSIHMAKGNYEELSLGEHIVIISTKDVSGVLKAKNIRYIKKYHSEENNQ